LHRHCFQDGVGDPLTVGALCVDVQHLVQVGGIVSMAEKAHAVLDTERARLRLEAVAATAVPDEEQQRWSRELQARYRLEQHIESLDGLQTSDRADDNGIGRYAERPAQPLASRRTACVGPVID